MSKLWGHLWGQVCTHKWEVSQSSNPGLGDRLDREARSLASSGPAENMLLAASSSEELDVDEEGKERESVEPSPSISPVYGELLDVMARTTARFNLT